MILRTLTEGDLSIQFQYSPFFEMMCSLHVLGKPEHHLGRLKWAEELKGRMDPQLLDELLFFHREFFEYLGAMDLPQDLPHVNDLDIPLFLKELRRMPLKAFFPKLTNELEPPANLKLNSALRTRFVDAVESYYECHFRTELQYLEPLLIRLQRDQAELCGKLGTHDYLARIHSRLEVTEEELVFYKYETFRFPFQELREIHVAISSFIHPHLLLGTPSEGILGLTYLARLTRMPDEAPVDLVKILKALGDGTRLKILRLIRQKNCSTQSLAADLSLSEASISNHLKLLTEAELLTRQRRGNYVYYHLDPFLLDRIPMDLFQYLD